MKALAAILIVAGIVIAVAVPMYLERHYQQERAFDYEFIRQGVVNIRDEKLVKPSQWPAVLTGGGVTALGILVLAITLAGQRRE